MEVSHDEVGIVEVNVKPGYGEEHPRDATEREGHQEAQRPQGVGLHHQGAAPERRQPVENFRTGWNRYEHGHDHEQRSPERVHSGSEHVVAPNDEPDDADAGHGEDHRFVPEDRAASGGRQHFRNNAKRRHDNDVHFRMSEEPEQVLEQQRVASSHEEGRADGVVEQEEGDTDDEGGQGHEEHEHADDCLLYTSDAADD